MNYDSLSISELVALCPTDPQARQYVGNNIQTVVDKAEMIFDAESVLDQGWDNCCRRLLNDYGDEISDMILKYDGPKKNDRLIRLLRAMHDEFSRNI